MDVLLPKVLWMAAVAAVFLAVNTALAAAALRVNAGQQPLDLGVREVAVRSFLAALGVTAYDIAALLLAPLFTPLFALMGGAANPLSCTPSPRSPWAPSPPCPTTTGPSAWTTTWKRSRCT